MRGRAASLPCPRCKSDDTRLVRRNRAPVRTPAGAILRGHVCQVCELRFVSAQAYIPDERVVDVA
jgi:transcriptional regulator NrdR family protein